MCAPERFCSPSCGADRPEAISDRRSVLRAKGLLSEEEGLPGSRLERLTTVPVICLFVGERHRTAGREGSHARDR
jgi:hypothetical protein